MIQLASTLILICTLRTLESKAANAPIIHQIPGCKFKPTTPAPETKHKDANSPSSDVDVTSSQDLSSPCVQPAGYDPQCYFFDKNGESTGPFESGPNCFFPLYNTDFLLHPKLLRYSEKSLGSLYPPWTYKGFHSPVNWWKIPESSFRIKTQTKSSKYTHIADPDSGISFIQPRPHSNLTSFHSSNCSNSLFPAPLDIITANAKGESRFMEFSFKNFDEINGLIMFFPEDGTDLLFVKLQIPEKQKEKKPTISSGATTGPILTFDRLLIHYGEKPNVGSEHKINGKSYGMELQFFFNLQDSKEDTPYYRTLENYLIQDDPKDYGQNLLVLCILVEVSNDTSKYAPSGKEFNRGMKILSQAADNFHSARNVGKYRAYASTSKVFQLSDFFDKPSAGHYYTYYGSLTHPPCFNNTRYAVFDTPIYMAKKDWRKFLFIPSQFSDTKFVAGNYRPMEVMTLRRSAGGKIVPYSEAMKLSLSYTVRKSRVSKKSDRLLEYDYYEDVNITKAYMKKHSKRNNTGICYRYASAIPLTLHVLCVMFYSYFIIL